MCLALQPQLTAVVSATFKETIVMIEAIYPCSESVRHLITYRVANCTNKTKIEDAEAMTLFTLFCFSYFIVLFKGHKKINTHFKH